MKKAIVSLALALFAAVALFGCGADRRSSQPDRIALPNGFQPEGISAQGSTIFVGSIPTGAVYRADVGTGNGALLVAPQAGRAAIGLKVDGRGRLFVAGGPTGMAFVYDAATGANLASYSLTTSATTFVNDVIVTSDAAWFTDSFNAVLYRVPIPADGTLSAQQEVSTLPLSGDFQLQPGFNLNGIEVSGATLIVVQSNTGRLFSVNPATGATLGIDLGAESVPNGDGLLLEGRTLFVVQNQLNAVAVVDLAPDLATGTVRSRISSPAFDVPTTIAAAGNSLYAMNARFGITVTPDTPYEVVRFDRP
jgi:sugar lactone lactonase YvrE